MLPIERHTIAGATHTGGLNAEIRGTRAPIPFMFQGKSRKGDGERGGGASIRTDPGRGRGSGGATQRAPRTV